MTDVQRRVEGQARIGPRMPLPLLANSTLCQAEKLSSCVQLTQLVVKGRCDRWPSALSGLRDLDPRLRRFLRIRPAALKASLL